jgi:leucyl aminopeptidase
MEVNVLTGDITQAQTDVLILSYFEDSRELEGDIAAVDKALDGAISQLVNRGEINGKFRELTALYTLGKLPSSKVAIVGLGKKADLTSEKIRVAVAEVCRGLRQRSPQNVSSVALGAVVADINFEDVGQAMSEGALLGTYTFRKHITKAPDYGEIQRFNIVEADREKAALLEIGCRKGKIIAEATILARDMVNEPSNFMTPADMAEMARQLSQKYNLGLKVIEPEGMKELGMGGILAVSQGSHQVPKLIILTYKGKESEELDVALVGKGITFDSGGLSLKPSENMGEMKGDMAGGASVMGAISAIARLKPLVNVTAIVPAAENLPGGTAMKPGDIITIMNGKTVEIISTDAEGRLVLADALSYARKIGARKLVDVATLTGSCRMALGDICSGVFGNNKDLIDQIISLGSRAGELMWQLPMNEEYKELNKSNIADIKNTGGRNAGAITAALFLSEFVESTPWVHLDIAGTLMTDKDRGYQVKGATGVAVRTLVDLVISLAEK